MGDSIFLAQFYFNYSFNVFATLDECFRFVMIALKVEKQFWLLTFGTQPQLENLLPGVAFPPSDLEEHKNEDMKDKPMHLDDKAYSDDDLGESKLFKLGKYEKAYIQSHAKDTENYIFLIKVLSKLYRSLQILSEDMTEYEASPYRMDNKEPLDFVKMPELVDLTNPNENVYNVLFGMKCANKVVRNEIAKLYGHIFYDDESSIQFTKNLIVSLNHEEFKEMMNYERILYVLLTLDDKYTKERIRNILEL